MLADLDLLLIAVFCTADDLLPCCKKNARRSLTDAEVVTLAVAQELLDPSSDQQFLEIAARRLSHLFPRLPKQPGYWKRRNRLAATIERVMAAFAADSPGFADPLVLVDSTPVECGRSLDTARRSALADACAHGYSRSHSRWFWGMRLHLASAPDGTPKAAILASADRKEREVALELLLPLALRGGEVVICDKGYAGRGFEAKVGERFGAQVLRPSRRDEPDRATPWLAPIRQRIESVFWTLKGRLGLERHRARTFHGLRARIAAKLCALAAGVWLNHLLGRPARAFADLSV